jgi:hypothetical protein
MDQAIRRIVEGENVERVLAEESLGEGAATVYYDFYNHYTGINNKAAWCPVCQSATVKAGKCLICGKQYPDGSVNYGAIAGRLPF